MVSRQFTPEAYHPPATDTHTHSALLLRIFLCKTYFAWQASAFGSFVFVNVAYLEFMKETAEEEHTGRQEE